MDRIGISLSLRRDRVSIWLDTLKVLYNPEFFRFLINEEEKKLAIEVCEYGDEGFHIVPDLTYENEYEICSVEMMRMIWDMCGWDPEASYRVMGELYSQERVVEFKLKEAEKILE